MAEKAVTEEYKAPITAHKIKEMWDKGIENRRYLDEEAWVNIAFIAGDQYAIYDPSSRRFVRSRGDDGKVRMKVNLLKPLWRTELSTLLEGKISPEVRPVSDEDTDRMAAQAGNRILQSELHRIDFEEIKSELLTWVTATGVGYLHPHWDKNGDNIEVDVVPHLELVVDPAAKRSLKQARWVIHGKVMTQDEAFDLFGQEFTEKEHQVPFAWSNVFTGKSVSTQQKGVLVLRMWYKPCRKYPQGFVVTIVDDKIVEKPLPFPFEHKELPFVDFHAIKLPGRFEGQSTLVDLIPLQKDYNQSRSRQAETRAIMAAGQWLAPENAWDPERRTNKPGETIFFRPVGPFQPREVQHPQPPAIMFHTADAAYSEMQDIAGQHEVSRGKTPSSGLSGAGIIALQEKDERKVAVIVHNLESGVTRLGRQLLLLVQQYWVEARRTRVWSEKTGEMNVAAFSGSDLQGGWDVVVQPGSAMPKSKSQQRQDLLALWDRQVIQDPRVMVRLLDLPNVESILDVMDSDARQARREHEKLRSGDLVVAESWHNHALHISEHNEFRKTDTFEQMDDKFRQALAAHVEEHEAEQMVKLQEDQMKLLMAQGGVPGAAGGGTPAPEEPANALAGLQATQGGGGIPGVNAPEGAV